MNENVIATAQRCLDGAQAGTMDFPTIVQTLMQVGLEGYDVDYRRATAVYFHSDGTSIDLRLHPSPGAVAAEFTASSVAQAVREAQQKLPGYTYAGFCEKVKAAGCAGYMVSFRGRRVLYFGRTAETHVEHFPK